MAVKLQQLPTPKIQRDSIRSFEVGVVHANDVGRTPTKGLVNSLNSLLYQDGTIGPAPSLVRYGQTFPGTVLGEVAEFVKTTDTGTENYLICMCKVGSVGKVYYSKDAGVWTEATGKTYDSTKRAHFKSGDTFVTITNGEDNFSYLSLADMTIKTFNPLPPVGLISVTLSGSLTSGTPTFPNRYRVAFSKNGVTAAGATVAANSNKQRATWTGTDGADIGIPIPTLSPGQDRPTRANIYWGETVGGEYQVASVPVPPSGTSMTWHDDGTAQQDLTHAAPNADSSSGLKATRVAIMFQQVFLFGVKGDIRQVYFGGTTVDTVFDFSAYGGGGSTQVGLGKDIPVNGVSFTYPGVGPVRMIVAKGTNGKAYRYRLTPATIQQGDIAVNYFKVDEDAAEGIDAPDSLLVYRNAMFYLSRDGIKSTFTKRDVQTILSVENIDDNIKPDVKTLNIKALENACAKEVDGRLLFAVPKQSGTNSKIWALDLNPTRKNGWMLDIDIAADWIEQYTDNSGVSRTLMLVKNVLYEWTDTVKTSYDGVGFSTLNQSGIIKFSEDGADWGSVLDVIAVFLRPQGDITFTVNGYIEGNPNATLGSVKVPDPSNLDDAGWGEAEFGAQAWGEIADMAGSTPDALVPVRVEIEDDVKYWSWLQESKGVGVSFQLAIVLIRYVNIGAIDLD